MNTMIILLTSLFFSMAKEPLKKWQVQSSYIEDGKGITVRSPRGQASNTFDENNFGFSFEKKSNEMGVCRLRLKVVCDYGLEFEKILKNTDISMIIDGKLLNGKTNFEGIMDGSFDCPSSLLNKAASLNVKKHQLQFALKDSPGVIKVPEKACR